ncbi:hypothetical protein [Roseomonas elaeocarpi]|uniref:Uncharacterized protein n=1 Tax=Roseomonas elaeocarpi TaxID=907779 RepID=A0ABV6JR08_9PROT
MTPQEIFDHAVAFLRETGGRDPRRVLGSLIPDRLYEPWMGQAGAETVCRKAAIHGPQERINPRADELPTFIGKNIGLLSGLAWAEQVPSHWDHDDVMRAALSFVAKKYDLIDTAVDIGGFVHEMAEETPDSRELEMARRGYWSALPPLSR